MGEDESRGGKKIQAVTLMELSHQDSAELRNHETREQGGERGRGKLHLLKVLTLQQKEAFTSSTQTN